MLRELIRSQYGEIEFGVMSDHIFEFLRSKKVPQWLIDELSRASTSHFVAIGPLTLPPVMTLDQNNSGEPYGYFCDSGFLNIAYGPNGDHIAVELISGKVLFVHHDELDEYFEDFFDVANAPDVRTRMIDTGMTFYEFWKAAATEKDFPCDAYEAEERWPRYLTE